MSLFSISRQLVIVTSLLVLTLWLCWESFTPGLLLFMDNPVHLAEAYLLVEEVIPHQHWITGWSGADFAGFPIQLYFYQLSFWLLSLLVFTTGCSVIWAYKVVIWGGLFFCGLTFYWMMRVVVGLFPAWLLSLVLVIRMDILWTAYKGTYNTLWGLGFLFLMTGYYIRTLEDWSLSKSAKLALLLAGGALSHPYLFIAQLFVLFLGLFFKADSTVGRDCFYGTAIAGLLFIGLTAFYFFPIIETAHWLPSAEASRQEGSLADAFINLPLEFLNLPKKRLEMLYDIYWERERCEFYEDLWRLLKQNYYMLVVNVVGFVGLFIFCFSRRLNQVQSVFFKITLLMLVICLVISLGYWFSSESFRRAPLLGMLQGFFSIRFLLVARICLIAFAGLALQKIWFDEGHFVRIKNKFRHRIGWRRWLTIVQIRYAVLIILIVMLVTFYKNPTHQPRMQMTTNQNVAAIQLFNFWSELANIIGPGNERVFCQTTFGNMKGRISSSHIMALASRHLKREAIGGWCKIFLYPLNWDTRTNTHTFGPWRLIQLNEERLEAMIQKYFARYLITCDFRPKKLQAMPDRVQLARGRLDDIAFRAPKFRKIHQHGPYCAYRYEGELSLVKDLEENDVFTIKEKTSYSLKAEFQCHSGRQLTLKIAYHPYWKAFINGQTIPVQRSEDSFLHIDLPHGEHYEIQLQYSSLRWSYVILTLICCVLVGLILCPNRILKLS